MTTRQFARRLFAKSFAQRDWARIAAERKRREREGRRHKLRLEQRAERNLAHRELQLVRAQATGDGRYIARRERLLDAAKQRLAYLKADLSWPAKA